MGLIEIASDKRSLRRDGKPFFYLADTVWCASTNAHPDEWLEYLDFRQAQGFTAIQLNILPQHDRTDQPFEIHPFETAADGRYDLSRPVSAYFERICAMADAACKRGLLPMLSLFWFDWAQDRWPRAKPHKPFNAAEFSAYLDYVIPLLRGFQPIFQCGGDVNFDQWPEHPREHYHLALKKVREHAPGCLTSLHLGRAYLPEELQNSPHLDLSIYQSGHQRGEEQVPWTLAKKCFDATPARPVINSEPCYEGHAFGGNEYGRWDSRGVRRAIWSSLLSGASAGVTYGAHGLWCWHRRGLPFLGEAFSGEPFEWRAAMHLPGASDAAFAREIFEKEKLLGIPPAQDLLEHRTQVIRVAAFQDPPKLAIYAPYSGAFSLKGSYGTWQWRGWSLETREASVPRVKEEGGLTKVEMQDENSDAVFVGEKQ